MLSVSESRSMCEPEHVTDFPRLQPDVESLWIIKHVRAWTCHRLSNKDFTATWCWVSLRLSASRMSFANECTSLVNITESGRLSPLFHSACKVANRQSRVRETPLKMVFVSWILVLNNVLKYQFLQCFLNINQNFPIKMGPKENDNLSQCAKPKLVF